MLILQVTLYSLVVASCLAKRGGSYGIGTSRSRGSSRGIQYTKKASQIGSIERTRLFRSAVFGAAAGYLTFRAGRHFINEPSQAIMFDQRSYYWDSAYYTPTEELPTQCVNKIDPQDPQFGRVSFLNESRPREIVYGCAENDYCCGFDCCQENTFFTSLFRMLILILVFSVLGVFFIEAFRWGLNCMYMCKYGHPRDCDPLSI